MANITDLFDRVSDSNTGRPIIADLASPGKAIGASSLNLTAATNWTIDSAIHFSIYETTTVGNVTVKDSSTQTDWKGTLSGTTIGNLTITGGTDRAYTAGAKVELTPTSRYAKDLYDGIAVGHNQNGTHKAFTESNIVPTAAIQDSAVTLAKIATGTNITKFANPHKFRVSLSATQTVTASTFTKVQLNTEQYDTGSNFDSTTNYRFVAPAAGFYQFSGRVQSNGVQSRTIASLYKNGTEYSRGGDAVGAPSSVSGSTVTDTIQLAQNDYVELYGFTSGTTFGVDGTQSCYLSGYLLSTT